MGWARQVICLTNYAKNFFQNADWKILNTVFILGDKNVYLADLRIRPHAVLKFVGFVMKAHIGSKDKYLLVIIHVIFERNF